jgi:hypothetical protein
LDSCSTPQIRSERYSRDVQIPGDRSPAWPNFAQRHLIFVGLQCGSCFMLPFWRLKYSDGSCRIEKQTARIFWFLQWSYKAYFKSVWRADSGCGFSKQTTRRTRIAASKQARQDNQIRTDITSNHNDLKQLSVSRGWIQRSLVPAGCDSSPAHGVCFFCILGNITGHFFTPPTTSSLYFRVQLANSFLHSTASSGKMTSPKAKIRHESITKNQCYTDVKHDI